MEEVGSGTEELVQRRVKMYIFHKSTGFFFLRPTGKEPKENVWEGVKINQTRRETGDLCYQ